MKICINKLVDDDCDGETWNYASTHLATFHLARTHNIKKERKLSSIVNYGRNGIFSLLTKNTGEWNDFEKTCALQINSNKCLIIQLNFYVSVCWKCDSITERSLV